MVGTKRSLRVKEVLIGAGANVNSTGTDHRAPVFEAANKGGFGPWTC